MNPNQLQAPNLRNIQVHPKWLDSGEKSPRYPELDLPTWQQARANPSGLDRRRSAASPASAIGELRRKRSGGAARPHLKKRRGTINEQNADEEEEEEESE
ncbi:hypothetical protein ACJRO7_029695 [Eucalyptus globulus]|uniref:Uncharacterized protein n=1 Tax=Eucalyptus globulus TaxID=34317 RepID=A0ABD3JCR6_EUCGL